MVAAFKNYLAIIKRVSRNNLQCVKQLVLPNGEHTVKFHPFLPYIFLGTRGRGNFQVYSNLTPDMQEDQWKLLLTGSGGSGCIGMSVFSSNKYDTTLIATAGVPSSVWNFRPYKRQRSGDPIPIRQPELNHAGTLYEDQRSRHMLISVAFLSKKYLLGGYKNGTIAIYKGRNVRTALGEKYTYNYGKKKWPDHRFVRPIPTVPCIVSFRRHLEAITGGNYGFVHFWKVTTNKDEGPLLEQDAEWELQYYKEQHTPIIEAGTMNDDRLQPLSQQAAECHEDSATAAGELPGKAGKSEATPSSSLAAGVQAVVSKELTENQQLEIIFNELRSIGKCIGLGVEQRATSAVQEQAAKSHQLSTLCEELQAVRRHIEKRQVVLSQLPEASFLGSPGPVAAVSAPAGSTDLKTSFELDMKPRGGSSAQDLERAIRSIEMEGLIWGKSTLITDEHGAQKMQITMTIDDIVNVKRLIKNCLPPCDILDIKKI